MGIFSSSGWLTSFLCFYFSQAHHIIWLEYAHICWEICCHTVWILAFLFVHTVACFWLVEFVIINQCAQVTARRYRDTVLHWQKQNTDARMSEKKTIWYFAINSDYIICNRQQHSDGILCVCVFCFVFSPQVCGDAHRPRVLSRRGFGLGWIWCRRRKPRSSWRVQGHRQM